MHMKNTSAWYMVTLMAIGLFNVMMLVEVRAEVPKNELIVFSTNPVQESGIWLMDPDGKNQRALLIIEGKPVPLGLVWSLDGSRIAFHTEINENIDVYVVDADGQNLLQLTNHEAEDSWPSWHPGGQKLAFCTNRDGNYEIYAVTLAGQGLVNLTNDSVRDREPAWSPDGRRIAFASKRGKSLGDIWVMDVNGGNLQNLTNVRGQDLQPRWSSDGEKVGWTSRRDGSEEIWAMDADGTNELKVSSKQDPNPGGSFDCSEPSWKPNGKEIASTALGGGSATIRIHASNGSLQRLDLARQGKQNRSPAWFDPDFAIVEFSVSPAEKQVLTWGWLKQMGRGN